MIGATPDTHAHIPSPSELPRNKPSERPPLPAIKSELSEAHERLLSCVVEYELVSKLRTAQDFLRHFPPKTIMEALEDQPELRGKILHESNIVGIFSIAKALPWGRAAEMLEMALEMSPVTPELTVTPEIVLSLFSPDDRVRYLDPRALWNFYTEDEFWRNTGDAPRERGADQRLSFILAQALSEKLVSAHNLLEGTIAESMQFLTRSSEGLVCAGKALKAAINPNKKFTAEDLLSIVPIEMLVKNTPPDVLWNVVIQYVAKPNLFMAQNVSDSVRELRVSRENGASHDSSGNGLGHTDEEGADDAEVEVDLTAADGDTPKA